MVVSHAGIDFLVQIFGFTGANRGEGECFFELGEVFSFDGDVEFTKGGESEAEHASGDTETLNGLVLDVVAQPVLDGSDEFAVFGAGGEVNPDFVESHGNWSLACTRTNFFQRPGLRCAYPEPSRLKHI